MKRPCPIIGACLLIAIALVILSRKCPHDGPAAAGPSVRIRSQANEAGRPSEPATRRLVDRTQEAVGKPEERRDLVFEKIQTAVITYAPEGVQPIAAHLLDSDPEIRESARQGLVQLGEADAIPLLRDAARRLTDGSESLACEEAAAFLELPSWSQTEEAKAFSAELAHPTSDP